MERAEEKMAANEVAASAEFKKKDCDLPIKPETCNMLGSSALHVSAVSDWPERSPHLCADILGGYSLNRCVTSSVESDSPSTNPYSRNDAGHVVEELTSRNYETAKFGSVSHSNIREGMHPVQSQWQHLYQLAGGHNRRNTYDDFGSSYKNLMLLSAKEEMRNRSKILSTSSFSQFFVKNSLKGKGVISRRTEAPTEFGLVVMDQNKEKQASVSRIPSDIILNSSAKDNSSQQRQHNVDRGRFQSFCGGISLRDWLKFVHHDINKIERLLLFRQIVQLVDFAHSQGVVLQHLCPSYFILLPSKKVKYIGSSGLIHQSEFSVNISRKRPLKEELHTYSNLGLKLQKLGENMRPFGHQTQLSSKCGIAGEAMDDIDTNVSDRQDLGYIEHKAQNTSSYQGRCTSMQQLSNSTNVQLEEKWYRCPEELRERGMLSSNIYSLGVLLFELLCYFESSEVHFAAMLDLRHRILPSHFLSENPKESGFCLWLLHPEPSSRPTTREILQSELLFGSEELYSLDDLSSCFDNDDDSESELLLHFLLSLKEEKQKHASKLAQDIGCLEADINEIDRRHLMSTSSYLMDKDLSDARKRGPHLEDHTNSDVLSRSSSMSNMNDSRLMRNVSQLEKAYFSVRSQTQLTETAAAERPDKDLLRNRERWSRLQNENEEHSVKGRPVDHIESFCEGLCKFARYSKFKVRGTLRYGDLLNSANVICSLSFDRDEDYIAAAGVSKKIKIFEFGALLNDSVDIHYPAVEMMNKSKLSCVCWNNYIRNYLASTDYDGVVQMWDATTGQGFAQYTEHQKRAWSVDFSQVHPKKFASGSDDCSVKLWSINEKNSFSTISNPANVCCVQFSAYSSHLLAFGSADYKTYCYDLRHTRIPWCTLAGHGKAVSYVKILDSETLVSASTDNTLKLWDLKKTSSEGLSAGACTVTFTGHANEKNFVGLSAFDGYISCGSETNEVYTYYRSLPMPITSHKFGSVDPVSGREVGDDSGQFVSSVCWRGKSNMVVAANSSGSMKLLQMV